MDVKNHTGAYPTKVSVCVVTYNQVHYIDECLRSIISQNTNFKFEVLVSDDGSTDGTREIISQYAKRFPALVLPVFQEKNLGAFRNFVQTHNMARGEYVCHCDGDDRWLPGKLQAQADFLDVNTDFTVVWHRVNLFADSGKFYPGERYDYSMFDDGVVTFSQSLRLGSIASHSSIMYRSSARETRNSTFETLDLYYTWEFLSKGKGKILDHVLGEYRVSSENGVASNCKIKLRKLNVLNSSYFFKKFPHQRKNIFMFSLLNMLIDLKNKRSTAKDFFVLALQSITFIKPSDFYKHVKIARKLRIPEMTD
jgi:glycosyltransferase involved in cell wall biosynthesis